MFAYTKLMQAMVESGTVSDTYFNRVTLLLNTNSTNGAQNNTFLDSSSNAFSITRNGNTTQGTFSPFSQTGWSNFFDGTGDYLSGGSSADYTLGTGDFSISCWIYPTVSATSTTGIFGVGGAVTGAFEIFTKFPTGGNNTLVVNGYAGTTVITTGVLNVNAWNYIAISRASGTLSVYLNGTRVANTSFTDNLSQTDAVIGRSYSNLDQEYFTGYISDFRIVKGTALYSGTTLTTPTTYSTDVTNTKLLTCNSNRFIDTNTQVSAKTITPFGNTSVQAFSPFLTNVAYTPTNQGGSGYFDGTGDSLSIANATAIQVGATYTIEGWFYPTSTGLLRYFGKFTSGVGGWLLLADTSTFTWYYAGAGGTTITGGWSPKVNAWNHVVVSANTTTMRVYLNGASVGSASTPASTQDDGSNLLIGDYNGIGGIPFVGYINGFRIVKGSTVYNPSSTTLTVPTAPLTAITNTSLLLNFTNAGIVDSTAKNVLETVGNAQISTTQSKFGGSSLYFDGTGDWLLFPDSVNLQMGSGDFTIEGWVYINTAGVAYGLISKGTSTTGWSVNITSGNKLQFSYTSSNLTGATSLSATTWYYFAVVRSGTATGNLKIYLNGTADATSAGAVTDTFNQTNSMYVGADRVGTSALNGYLDEIRVTKGYARTIATPTAAFPVQ